MLRVVLLVLCALSPPLTILALSYRVNMYQRTRAGINMIVVTVLVLLAGVSLLSYWVQMRLERECQYLLEQKRIPVGVIDSVQYQMSMATGMGISSNQSVVHVGEQRFIVHTRSFSKGELLERVTLPDGRNYLATDRHLYHFEK